MKPGHYDLPTIWRGCDYPAFTLTWLDFTGSPIDLTMWTPFAHSRNIDFHPSVIDAVNGVTQIVLFSSETADLKLGVEEWDWFFVSNSGFITPPLLSGTVPIKEPTTVIPVITS
jgi:hypothetical protein